MIVLISESLPLHATATDGCIPRDRMLPGFYFRMDARWRTFLAAISAQGKQFRMMLGHWPLTSAEEALQLHGGAQIVARPQSAKKPAMGS
jgi:hypothetical protein